MRGMVIHMEEAKLQTLAQIKAFLDGTSEVAFRVSKEGRNPFIERVLKRFSVNQRTGGAMERNKIQIYQTADGQVRLEVALEQDTVWLSQAQMVELFGRDQSVVSRHIRNALAEGEVTEKSNMQKMHIANSDRPVVIYDLDVVISVGYRIKSERGVQFRRWASNVLRQHLVQG